MVKLRWVALVVVGLSLFGCSPSDDGSSDAAPPPDAAVTVPAADDAVGDDGDAVDEEQPDPEVGVEDEVAEAEPCDDEELGADDETSFTVAHRVIDGELVGVCLGEEDPTLLQAWDDLVAITPPTQLNDLTLFAGFASDEESDEVTLAFVNAVDSSGETFQMSVNLDSYAEDEVVALLTIAHEFAHVFTQVPSQLDLSDEAFESCPTFASDAGCFAPDSLLHTWVDAFWADELELLDPDVEPSIAEGEARCDVDPSFLGPYAASDPEEDFAETFSAYVFDVAVATPEQQAKVDWMADQPGLLEFRDRADAAGLVPLDHQFEPCG